MRAVSYVLGNCIFIISLFIFSSCEKTYDEIELRKDIQKKKDEIDAKGINSINDEYEEVVIDGQKTKIAVFNSDTFRLPAVVIPEYHIVEPAPWGIENYYTYTFDPADKDTLLQSLFNQTAALSEYGNFRLDKKQKPYINGETTLKEALICSSPDDTNWHYIGSNGAINSIRFSSKSISIGPSNFTLDKDGVIQ